MQNIIGQKFNRLTVIARIPNHWLCKCECGNEIKTSITHLRNGKVKSCGCLNKERILKHGHTKNKKVSPEWQSWRTMRSRCYRTKDCSYKNYGGRGITVCDRWKNSFENFLEDMGKCPENCTLDRIDSNKNYEPENCRWATGIQQGNNRRNNTRIIHNGISKTITEWAREMGVSWTTIDRWRKKGKF